MAGWIAVTEPVLHQVDAQHHLESIRPSAVAGLGIERLDHRQQRLLRHHLFHLAQELLPSRLLALAGILGVGEAQLRHDRHLAFGRLIVAAREGLVQSFPKGTNESWASKLIFSTFRNDFPSLESRRYGISKTFPNVPSFP